MWHLVSSEGKNKITQNPQRNPNKLCKPQQEIYAKLREGLHAKHSGNWGITALRTINQLHHTYQAQGKHKVNFERYCLFVFSQRENTHWFKQAPWKELSGTLHCIPHPCAGLHILTHKEIFHVSKRQWPQNEKGIWGAHTFEFPGCILLPWLDFSVVCAPGQWFPIKPFGVCKGLSVRSMKHGKSCLLVRGWSAELYQGSEGALLGSFWFEMLICPTQSLLRLIEGLKMWVLAVPPLFSIIPWKQREMKA